MNILPLILALVLMLSVLTVERLEKFKNQTAVQKEYQLFLKESDRQIFNKRQEKLADTGHDKDIKQLSFRFIIDKKAREKDEDVTKQYRTLIIKLMKILYGEADFFKELEKKRSNFLEEMLAAVEKAADAAPEKTIKRVEDIARLNLGDPELQDAFYHMLKGTVTRKKIKELNLSEEMKGRAYVSLFNFINYDGSDGNIARIEIQHSPYEILKAVFGSDEVASAILIRRNELAKERNETAFRNEFKASPGISDKLLDFKLSGSDKTDYN